MIVELPDLLVVELLNDWFDFVDVGNLDCSLTNKKSREIFLNILSSEEMTFTSLPDSTIKVGAVFMYWLSERGVKLSILRLNENMFDGTYECLIFDINQSKVTEIIATRYVHWNKVTEVMHECPNLRTLKFEDDSSWCVEEMFAIVIPERLSALTAIHNVYSDFKFITEKCSNLTFLSIGHPIDVDDEKTQKDIIKLLIKNKNMKRLEFLYEVKAEFLKAVIENCPNIDEIEIKQGLYISKITDVIKVFDSVEKIIVKSHTL